MIQSQGIDIVERLEFAFRIPPARGQRAEFREFCRISICLSCRHDIGLMFRESLLPENCLGFELTDLESGQSAIIQQPFPTNPDMCDMFAAGRVK